MPDKFRNHIRSALANPNLQAALDANAERRLEAREKSYSSLTEDIQTLRRRAHTVRAETIANLEEYLRQFVARAEANGMFVHHAEDADQAVQIVLKIARENEARLIAKSKTMVSEEIELNHALESAGLRVVETDLGEYIVQLRGERPAHIITPAVHLRRGEVGETFHEKLGIDLTDDIPTMTAAARKALRQVFLEADIGISGVNFGVVDTGTLCLVTNEGNGRMITTLPPVHIALLGIERLVPTMDDLALMLALLPRAATGQKMTVYTNLINGPRRPGEADGPRERHVILVDNGRRAMQASPLAEALLCIRCGACLNACPVFREIGGHAYVSKRGEGSPYSGPIGAVISPSFFGQAEFGQLARASSLCGACKEACPVDIDLPRLLLRVRAGGQVIEPNRAKANIPTPVAWGLRVYTWFATRPRWFKIAQRSAGLLGRLVSPFSPWMRMPAVSGWGVSKDMPRPAARPFRDRIRQSGSGALVSSSNPAGMSQAIAGDQVTDKHTSQQNDHLVDRFKAELTELGGSFYICPSAELAEKIAASLAERGIKAIAAWEGRHLPPNLLENLQKLGLQVSYQQDPILRAGLTGALAGIAETGTLVLPGGPGHPQITSLLPETHIAILRASAIQANLAQVLNLSEVKEAATVALITGPSRTADIEMTLTIGVHGPGEVHVFCVPE